MRAFLSFILVLLSLMLLQSSLELNAQRMGTKAILVERSYSLSMNVKESIIESLRQGAREGFSEYDSAHDVSLCKHCPVCAPKTCDPALCRQCFREHEARDMARQGATSRLESLRSHPFDDDFQISISDPALDVHTRANPLSKNGFELDSLKVRDDIRILIVSKKFDLEGQAEVPGGLVMDAGDD